MRNKSKGWIIIFMFRIQIQFVRKKWEEWARNGKTFVSPLDRVRFKWVIIFSVFMLLCVCFKNYFKTVLSILFYSLPNRSSHITPFSRCRLPPPLCYDYYVRCTCTQLFASLFEWKKSFISIKYHRKRGTKLVIFIMNQIMVAKITQKRIEQKKELNNWNDEHNGNMTHHLALFLLFSFCMLVSRQKFWKQQQKGEEEQRK